MNANRRKDLYNILILTAIALVLGIYLIATTVVISKDGVFYIERSKQLVSHFDELIKSSPPIGFNLMILGFHKIYSSIFKTQSLQSWITSAQICVLACKILAIVALYFFGRHFFSRKQVFISLLIVSFLPYPTQFGADILRDWPHILFLFSAMLFLIKGIKQSSGLYMTLTGLTCGFGHIIRPECPQVVLYGFIIFSCRLYQYHFKKVPFSRKHIYLFLLVGFLLIFIPYAAKRDKVLPDKLKTIISTNDCISIDSPLACTASVDGNKILSAAASLVQAIIENFHYYFILPMGIGMYRRFFRKKKLFNKKYWLIGLFIGFNAVILLLLHFRWGYISKRHAMPLNIILSFYIPSGITAIAAYFSARNKFRNQNLKRWRQILIWVGILICLPKLLRPIGQDKKVYLEAAKWINTHTLPSSRFFTFDSRIPFYANREDWVQSSDAIQWAKEPPDYLICASNQGRPSTDTPDVYTLMKIFENAHYKKDIYLFHRPR